MRKTWERIFLLLLSVSIIIIVLGPLLVRFSPVGIAVSWWLNPITSHLDSYTALLGALIGSALTISGAMWQNEYSSNKLYLENEKKNLKYILNELNSNKDKLELIKSYFEVNSIEKVYFYPDNEYELWSKHDGTTERMATKNDRGISNLKMDVNKKFLINEISLYTKISEIEDIYDKFSKINMTNGLDYTTVKMIYRAFISTQKSLQDFLEGIY